MNTFGNSLAARKLETLVEDNNSARRKISSLLSRYTSQLLTTTTLNDSHLVRLYMKLLRDHTIARLNLKHGLNADIVSYGKNVIDARYRAFLHGYENVLKHKNKRK